MTKLFTILAALIAFTVLPASAHLKPISQCKGKITCNGLPGGHIGPNTIGGKITLNGLPGGHIGPHTRARK